MGQKFDFGILMDLHVLRSPESKKKCFFTKCLSVVRRLSGPIKTIVLVEFRSNFVIEL